MNTHQKSHRKRRTAFRSKTAAYNDAQCVVYTSDQAGFFATLLSIVHDIWTWRSQIIGLARFEVVKQSRGAALSWVWFFARPAVYILCFWFALAVGLRAGDLGGSQSAPPYILWLAAGVVPWFFLQEMLGSGINALSRYPYLVNKVRFPLSCVSAICASGELLLQLMLQAVLLVMYFLGGQPFDVHLLQIPFLLVLMWLFFVVFSIGMSQLTALSKDFANLMRSLSTPLFWLSGVIFDVTVIPFAWAKALFLFNPVTFFISAFRDAYYYRIWIWEDSLALACFAVVFLVTAAFSVVVYRRFCEEVPDAF